MLTITSIQKYSIHDGDGIRTTVFFKGCPLTCVWCHNPETQTFQKQTMHNIEKCTNCAACINACPNHAIDIKDSVVTDFEKCTTCGNCIDYCVLNLREIMGSEYSIDELVKCIRQDEMFYEESGGGVTLSGGEVMTQNMEHIEALLKALTRIGISVNIDTCGYAPYLNFSRILPYVDTFLYDLKIMDAQKHQAFVGTDNQLIFDNLKKLSNDGAKINLRLPLMREINGNQEEMQAVIHFLVSNHIQVTKINLLPYHNTGSGKYNKLGKEYKGMHLHAPTKEELEEFQSLFMQAGFHNTKIGG
jgi:glycyl-radical enzyme activating protein family